MELRGSQSCDDGKGRKLEERVCVSVCVLSESVAARAVGLHVELVGGTWRQGE
jgi:hypothetical protein